MTKFGCPKNVQPTVFLQNHIFWFLKVFFFFFLACVLIIWNFQPYITICFMFLWYCFCLPTVQAEAHFFYFLFTNEKKMNVNSRRYLLKAKCKFPFMWQSLFMKVQSIRHHLHFKCHLQYLQYLLSCSFTFHSYLFLPVHLLMVSTYIWHCHSLAPPKAKSLCYFLMTKVP